MEARDYVQELIAAGLTQQDIAGRTGLAQPTISKVLRGEVNDVLSRNYRRLQALHLEVLEQHAGVKGVLPAVPQLEPQHAN